MSLVCSSSLITPTQHLNPLSSHDLKLKRGASKPYLSISHPKLASGITKSIKYSWTKPCTVSSSSKNRIQASQQSFTENSTLSFDWEDQEDVEDTGSPWEGAVVYKRNSSITHVEYCTTLERLGLGRLSTEISKSRASMMGLRVTKAVKDYPDGTPVQISVDVIRKKQKLRLDGIVRTVITLCCNRCAEPAAESVFSNFSLLLTEEPIEEPETIDLGFSFGKDKVNSFSVDEDEDDDDSSIDWEDRLYFPPEVNEVDISKHVRDLVHLEITINGICDPMCKGICLECGTNLNKRKCSCSREEVKEKGYGPLGNLREQMHQKRV